MAGDWIPMRCDLAEDPAVIVIAAECNMDEFAVVGRLHRLWSWANRHTTDGNAKSVSSQWVDRFVSAPGFAAAMTKVGWLQDRSGGVLFPSFERWNSQSAKQRALTAKRVSSHKAKGNADGNAKGNAPSVSDALPKEENRREEENKEPPNPPKPGGEIARPPPVGPSQKTKTAQRPESVPIPPGLNTPEFLAAWAEWLEYRRGKKKPVSEKAAAKQLAELAVCGPKPAIETIQKSIANDYQGLFPPKTSADGKHTNGFRTHDQRVFDDIQEILDSSEDS